MPNVARIGIELLTPIAFLSCLLRANDPLFYRHTVKGKVENCLPVSLPKKGCKLYSRSSMNGSIPW